MTLLVRATRKEKFQFSDRSVRSFDSLRLQLSITAAPPALNTITGYVPTSEKVGKFWLYTPHRSLPRTRLAIFCCSKRVNQKVVSVRIRYFKTLKNHSHVLSTRPKSNPQKWGQERVPTESRPKPSIHKAECINFVIRFYQSHFSCFSHRYIKITKRVILTPPTNDLFHPFAVNAK